VRNSPEVDNDETELILYRISDSAKIYAHLDFVYPLAGPRKDVIEQERLGYFIDGRHWLLRVLPLIASYL
jgi:hypothetical protein